MSLRFSSWNQCVTEDFIGREAVEQKRGLVTESEQIPVSSEHLSSLTKKEKRFCKLFELMSNLF